MAIYHLSLKVGARGKAKPHFNYITASGSYERKNGVVHIEHGNMPLWASNNPGKFWQASDEFERANGTAYRELEVSLPRELPLEKQLELVRQLVEDVCGNKHAFSFAIHHAQASDGSINPHVHLQFSERICDGIERDPKHYFKRANKNNPEKGGCVKDRSWQARKCGKQRIAESSEKLFEVRYFWEVICNQALEDYGQDAQIDCRSNKERGIETVPQPKVGAKSWHLFQRTGVRNKRFCKWEQVIASNNAIIARTAEQAMEERYNNALRVAQEKHSELTMLKPVQKPRPSNIADQISASKSHLMELKKKSSRLERRSKQKKNAMRSAESKRNSGNNFFTRLWNKILYTRDFARLEKEYENALQKKKQVDRRYHSEYRNLRKLREEHSEYNHHIKCYNDYVYRKETLTRELSMAQSRVEQIKRDLPSLTPSQTHAQLKSSTEWGMRM